MECDFVSALTSSGSPGSSGSSGSLWMGCGCSCLMDRFNAGNTFPSYVYVHLNVQWQIRLLLFRDFGRKQELVWLAVELINILLLLLPLILLPLFLWFNSCFMDALWWRIYQEFSLIIPWCLHFKYSQLEAFCASWNEPSEGLCCCCGGCHISGLLISLGSEE